MSESISDVIDKVAGKLDAIVDTSTTPSKAQVINWLNDGLMLITKTLPDHRLSWLLDRISPTVQTAYTIDNLDIMRVTSVVRYGRRCRKVDSDELNWISGSAPYSSTEIDPTYAVSGVGGMVTLRFWPESMAATTVEYIHRPAQYSLEGWDPLGRYTPPPEAEDIIVDYAVIQGKIQDEELEQAMALWNQWKERYQIEAGPETLGVRGAT